MTQPTYNVYVDWNCADWAGTHDFSQEIDDITSFVLTPITISREKKPDDQVYPAATLELRLNNADGRFYPTLSSSPLYGLIRLWLPVMVTATFNASVYQLFYGYINTFRASPLATKQDIYLYATDGTDLLAKTIVIQDMDDKTIVTDGAAVEAILDAAGWNSARRVIAVDGGNIVNMPDTFAFEKPA